MVLKGKRPEENQVSKTSSSYYKLIFSLETLYFLAAISFASSSDLAMTQSSPEQELGIFPEPSIVTK